jgi:hypothetical protein
LIWLTERRHNTGSAQQAGRSGAPYEISPVCLDLAPLGKSISFVRISSHHGSPFMHVNRRMITPRRRDRYDSAL